MATTWTGLFYKPFSSLSLGLQQQRSQLNDVNFVIFNIIKLILLNNNLK